MHVSSYLVQWSHIPFKKGCTGRKNTYISRSFDLLPAHDHRSVVGEATCVLIVGCWIVGELVESGEELWDVWVDGRGGKFGDVVRLWHDERTGCGSDLLEANSQCR
jgi:hypothetical protein